MATYSKTAPTAEDQALVIPEILESILLQLPLLDLLVNAQRISHTWKRAIDSSPAIQQELFFQPTTLKPNQKPYFNQLLQKAFPPWFGSSSKDRCGRKRRKIFEELPWSKNKAAFARKEASWRKMLPVQPAATFLGVISKTDHDAGSDESVGEVKFEEGVRMGVLYDLGYKTVAEPISSFRVRWNMMTPMDLKASGYEDSALEVSLQISLIARETKHTEEEMITMRTKHVVQCCVNMKPNVGDEFRSEGFEDLLFDMTQILRLD